MMKFVLYTSILNQIDYDAFVVPDVIKIARTQNNLNGITGVLLFDGRNFTQYFEGEEKDVNRLLENILRDKRHTNVVVILSGHHNERLYKDWSMGLFYTSDQLLTQNIISNSDFSIEAFRKMVDYFDVE